MCLRIKGETGSFLTHQKLLKYQLQKKTRPRAERKVVITFQSVVRSMRLCNFLWLSKNSWRFVNPQGTRLERLWPWINWPKIVLLIFDAFLTKKKDWFLYYLTNHDFLHHWPFSDFIWMNVWQLFIIIDNFFEIFTVIFPDQDYKQIHSFLSIFVHRVADMTLKALCTQMHVNLF